MADRLDTLLVLLGHYESRARARDAIKRGVIVLNGKTATKPSALTEHDAEIAIRDPAQDYVSRAALKLIAGLEHFRFDPKNRTAIDIGASTGGFTQVLLERGCKTVFAVDVGKGQLATALQHDPRITLLEKTNARHLNIAPDGPLGDASISAVVSDVSFISLKLALPPSLERATQGAWAVLLVKPQFEAGRASIGKGGLVKDSATAQNVAEEIASWIDGQMGWRTLGLVPSPIKGGDGNREFLLGAIKDRA